MRSGLVAMALCVSCGEDPSSHPSLVGELAAPNIVIVGLDTVRADHLGAYGSKTAKTPHLDAFAREAVLFERCSTPSTWTLPAFASLFTGLLPYHHGATGGPQSGLEPAVTTLAERLRAEGYQTQAFVAVDYLTAAFSMDRGFAQHRSFVEGPVSTRSSLYHDEVVAFLRERHEQPFLLFVHYYDAHSPYDPPPPFDRMYYDGDPYAPENDGLRLSPDPGPSIYHWLDGVTDTDFPVQQYAAGITHLDESVGRLLGALRDSGVMDRSIVVVVADHGEHLTEHDVRFYHRYPYEEVLRVPLMIRLPGGIEGSRRVGRDVSLVDVAPTLFALLGLPQQRGVDGVSLAGAMRGEEALVERLSFAEFGGVPHRWVKAAWDERYRLLSFNLKGHRWTELYDREADPSERRNLAETLPRERDRLSRAIDARFPAGSRIRPSPAPAAQPIAPAVRQRLRALGYEE